MTDREKLVELIEQVYYCSIEETAKHLLANGVVVLPCKVGDEVWKVEPTGCNGAGCPYNGDFGNWRCNVNGKEECRPFVYSVPFTYAMIGTKFYLTREKAEAALKEGRNGE